VIDLSDRNCLVLGGLGFIGSHVVDGLVAGGYKVRVFDLPNMSAHNLSHCIHAVEIVGGDFYNIHDIERALEGIDVVVHLVGTTVPGSSNENPVYDVESNVIGTLKLLEKASQKKKIRKMIFASSGGTIYGAARQLPIPETHDTNPLCSYGITKLIIEKYLHLYSTLYNFNYTVLRLGNVYGERQRIEHVQGAIAVFLGKVLRNQPINIWGDGSVSRDFLHISDLVRAFMSVIGADPPSRVYNISGGRAYSLNEILQVMREVTGCEPRVSFTENRRFDVPINWLDISRAREELVWQPEVCLKEGIDRTWQWLKASHNPEMIPHEDTLYQ
jgi:UDP-glucose 4-epimerase